MESVKERWCSGERKRKVVQWRTRLDGLRAKNHKNGRKMREGGKREKEKGKGEKKRKGKRGREIKRKKE